MTGLLERQASSGVRVERFRALAWSLPDVLPAARVAVLKGAIRGEAPSGWELCGACDGTGAVVDKWGRSSGCDGCQGAGRFRVDVFTGQRVSGDDSPAPARVRRVTCDRCGGSGVRSRSSSERLAGATGLPRCEPCDGTGGVSVALVADEGPLLDTPGARRRERGDWDALEVGLGLLGGVDREALRAFLRVRVAGLDPSGPLEAARAAEGERWLLRGMPVRVRVPADVVVAYRERDRRRVVWRGERSRRVFRGGTRRARARELVGQGLTQAAVAVELGVSQQAVSRMVRG